jgi:hypothetical protein
MQRLGYSSYWMEVGSYGGTEITDCALSVGYKISKLSDTSDSIYSNSKYSLNRLSDFVPLGIITDGQQTADLSGLTRGEIQQLVYTQVLGGEGEAVIDYTDSLTESSSAVTRTVNGYSLTADNVLSCTLDISGRQSLYLDMFQGVSSNLTDKCYGSLSVTVNGLTADESYPSQTQNGLLKLGEFENERVTVTVTVEKSAAVESFGLFGVDLDKISATADSVRSADLKYTDGGIYGSVTASEGEYCAVTVPQSDSLTVKVNGRTVDTETFMGDFVLIPLTEGENDIEITSTPKGFTAGLLLSLIGAVLTVLYCIFGKKIKPSERLETVCIGITTALGGLVVAAVYVIPLLIHNA